VTIRFAEALASELRDIQLHGFVEFVDGIVHAADFRDQFASSVMSAVRAWRSMVSMMSPM